MPTTEDPPAPAPRRARSRVLRWAGTAAGILLALGVSLVGALNVDPVGTWVAARVAAAAAPDGVEVEIGRVSGSWLRSLRVTGLRMAAEGRTVLAMDTLRIEYHLPSLPSKRIQVGSLELAGADLRLRRLPDGSVGLPGIASPDSAPAPSDDPSAPSPWRVAVDHLSLRGLSGELEEPSPDGTGTLLSWVDVEAELRDLRTDPGFSLRAQRVSGRVDVPTSPAGRALGPVLVRLAGDWTPRRIALDTLEARGGGGRLRAAGTLALPDTGRAAEPVDLELHADSFPLAPLHALLGHRPDDGARLDGSVRIRGTTAVPTAVLDLGVGPGRLEGTVAAAVDGSGTERFTADVAVRDFDPAAVTGDTAWTGRIDARIDGALEGPARTRLGGRVRVEASRIALPGVPLSTADLDSEWSDGSAAVRLEARGDLGSAHLDGTVRPLDARTSWDLQGPLDVRIPGDGDPSGRIAAHLATRGEGLAPDSAEVDATLAVSELEVRGARLDTATLRARLVRGEATWSLDARDAGLGTAVARGRVTLATSPDSLPRFRVDSARIRDLDVAGLLGDSVESRLDARLTASGELGRPEAVSATLGAAVRQVRYGAVVADTVALDARLSAGRLDADLRVRSPAGAAEAALTARPFLERPAWTLHDLAFRDLDAGALRAGDGTAPPLTRLKGTLSGTGRGLTTEAMQADLRVALDSSRVNRQTLAGGEGRLAVEAGEARLAVTLIPADTGEVELEAHGRPFDSLPSLEVDRLTFRGIDPLAWAGTPPDGPVNVRLQGSASGALEGVDPATLSGSATVRLGPSRLNEEPIDDGRIEIRLRDARVEAEADLTLGHGRWTADAGLGWAGDSTAYTLASRLRSDAPGRLLGRSGPLASGRLDVTIDAEGRGLDLADMDGRLRLVADSAVVGRVRADTLRLAVRLREGALSLDTLRVRSNVLDARGRGRLPLVEDSAARPADLTVEVTVGDLTPVSPWVGTEPLALGTGDLRLTVEGPPDDLRLAASARASAALVGTAELAGLSLELDGTLDPGARPASADVHLELDRLTLADVDVRRTTVDAAWTGEDFTVEGESVVDDRRDLRFSVRASPRTSRSRATLERLDVRVDDDRWSLVGAPSVAWGGAFTVDSLRLEATDQAILVDGRFDAGGESDLRARVEALRIGGVADLLELEGLDGTLTSSLRLEGPAVAPRLRAEVEADLRQEGGRASTVTASLAYDSLRADLDASVRSPDGGSLALSGHLPLEWRLASTGEAAGGAGATMGTDPGPVDLSLTARNFAVAWAEPFLDAAVIRGLGGRLEADARVEGTGAAPTLSGSARLRDAHALLPALGVTYEGVVADVALDGDLARLDSAVVRTDDGVLRLDGTVSLPELTLGSFDLRARLDRFKAVHNDAFRVRVSGTGALVGTTAAPRLQGDLRLVETDVYLGDAVPSGASVQPIELTEAQIRELEETLGYPVRRRQEAAPGALFEALELDLSVAASRDTWVRQRANPELEVQLTGEVDVTKEPRDSLRFDGRIEAVARRSWVEQFGRRFRIEEGVVDLRGTAPRTRIDVRAAYEVPTTRDDQPEATITLDVEGTPDDLELTLGSDPSMENADIVSYLATGRPAASSLDFQRNGEGGGLRSVGSEFALGQVAGLVEGLAAEGVGLDVVEIRTDGLRGATLIAGRFVTPEVYVGFKQPVGRDTDDPEAGGGFDRTEVELELQALRWLLLNMEASNSAVSFLFRFRHAY